MPILRKATLLVLVLIWGSSLAFSSCSSEPAALSGPASSDAGGRDAPLTAPDASASSATAIEDAAARGAADAPDAAIAPDGPSSPPSDDARGSAERDGEPMSRGDAAVRPDGDREAGGSVAMCSSSGEAGLQLPGPWTPTELLPTTCPGTGPTRNPTAQLTTFRSELTSRATWETRAQTVREGMQKKMRLSPWPTKTPLNAVVHSRKVQSALGVTIENVSFESAPGFFVTGNLYRPLQCTAAVPGILRVHGHGTTPRFEADFQRHCAAMASMGAVVFGYDMVGIAESNQVAHCFPEAVMAAQTWNTIRAVDFLLSLGVDPARIGITGESGGGTQSYIATAMDPRIALSMPGVIVGGTAEGIWMGGCNCEATGMGVDHDADPSNDIVDYATNSIDMAALAAPRFQLIISDTLDTLAPNAPTTTMPYLQTVYGLYGALDRVASFVDDTGHNYAANKRAASYRFLADKFHMGPALPDESKYTPYSPNELRSFTPEHPRPAYALTSKQQIVAALLR